MVLRKNHASKAKNTVAASTMMVTTIPCLKDEANVEKNGFNRYDSRPSKRAKQYVNRAIVAGPRVMMGRLQINQSNPARARE